MAEPDPADECEGSGVAWLHVGFDTVESFGRERVAQRELERLARQSLTGGCGVGIETAVAVLKAAPDDLAEVDHRNQRVVVAAPSDE